MITVSDTFLLAPGLIPKVTIILSQQSSPFRERYTPFLATSCSLGPLLTTYEGRVCLGKRVTIIKEVLMSPIFLQCRRWTWVSTMFVLVRKNSRGSGTLCYTFSELTIIPIGPLPWSLLGYVGLLWPL